MSEGTEGAEIMRRDDGQDPVPAEAQDRSQLPTGMLEPVADPSEIVQSRTERSEMIADALEEGRDYGSVQGIPKPFLHKPGAERLTDAFGCYPRFQVIDSEVDHDRPVEWEKRNGKSGKSRGLYRYVVSCEVVHRASGIVVGNGLGACSTMEDKYVESPRNNENTALKMAKKRAHVDASLSTFGLSEMFTQDPEAVQNGGAGSGGGHDLNCPDCGGPVWDNTDDPKAALNEGEGNRPSYKCKDDDCGWATWPSDEDTLDEIGQAVSELNGWDKEAGDKAGRLVSAKQDRLHASQDFADSVLGKIERRIEDAKDAVEGQADAEQGDFTEEVEG